MIDMKKAYPRSLDTPIVCDYPDVFSNELSRLPPQREIEFAIDVVPSATPASITPYGMAPVELKELKLQFHHITMGSTSALC